MELPTVTALRELRGGRVAVELDGRRWRTFAAGVVVEARLGVGEVLDRARLRELARARRRARAFDTALRAVARREQTTAALRRRLDRRGVAAADRDSAVDALERVGLVDDARYALRWAESLAERGYGDAAIRWRLEREGVGAAAATNALDALERESDRARRLVSGGGVASFGPRELARRGFSEEAIEGAVPDFVAEGT